MRKVCPILMQSANLFGILVVILPDRSAFSVAKTQNQSLTTKFILCKNSQGNETREMRQFQQSTQLFYSLVGYFQTQWRSNKSSRLVSGPI